MIPPRRFSILLILTFILLTILGIGSFWRGETMSPDKVKEKWGSQTFNAMEFKMAGINQRSKMAYSLLNMQDKFIGKTVFEIENMLSPSDGFYFSDAYPAYMIQRGEKIGDESWQIVFLIDNSRKVKSVIVHKNCCD